MFMLKRVQLKSAKYARPWYLSKTVLNNNYIVYIRNSWTYRNLKLLPRALTIETWMKVSAVVGGAYRSSRCSTYTICIVCKTLVSVYRLLAKENKQDYKRSTVFNIKGIFLQKYPFRQKKNKPFWGKILLYYFGQRTCPSYYSKECLYRFERKSVI